MSYIFKFRGADSSPAGSSESPQLPALKSAENHTVGTSSVPGNKLFQQNCQPSAQMQSQLSPKVPRITARKTFPHSKNNLPVTSDKDQKNLETTAPLFTKSIIQPAANADWTSPIPSKRAICQESPRTFTPHQLNQSQRKTPANDAERKLPSLMEMIQTSSIQSTQQKATLAPQIQTVDKTSSEKDKGPLADLNENVLPSLTPALTTQMMKDSSVEARMAALHGEPLDIVEEVVANVAHEVSINSDGSDLTIELSDSEFTPSKPALKPSRSSNKSASKVAKAPVEKKAGKPESGLSREVARLLQDEGAERIMQEMEGKGASRRRTTTKDWFSRDTRQEKRVIDVEEVKDEDEKKTKKNKRPRTDSVTATTADSFSADRNPLQHWQVVNVSFLILLFNI